MARALLLGVAAVGIASPVAIRCIEAFRRERRGLEGATSEAAGTIRSCDRTGHSGAGGRSRSRSLFFCPCSCPSRARARARPPLLGLRSTPGLESALSLSASGGRDGRAQGVHHRDHRPGRQLPGRAAAREGLRGPRPRPPQQLLQHLAHRPRPRPARSSTTATSSTRTASCAPWSWSGPTRSTTWPPRATSRSPSRCRSTPRRHRAGRAAPARRRARAGAARRASTRRAARRCSASCRRRRRREKTPFHPRSPYGVAKVFGHWMTVNYREGYGMHVSNGILFNHESPRRGENFVTRKITMGVAAIKNGREQGAAPRQPRRQARLGLRQGLRRGDVADAAAGAARRLRGRHGRDALRARVPRGGLLATSGLDWQDYVKVDPKYFRPAEVDVLLGDPAKARRSWAGSRRSASRSWCA